MEFRLLGPVEARSGGAVLPLGGVRRRSVLAVLLLRAGAVVPTDELVDLVWDGSPPPTAVTALHGHVSGLRKVLGPAAIATVGSGYVARVAPGRIDAARFEALLDRARAQPPAAAVATFDEALALWRGPALADLRAGSFAQDAVRRLEELRVAALEDRLAARLELGQAVEVVPELEALLASHPLRERPRALLMLALYRSGRQAEALSAFTAGRRRLVDELGIEPGEPLRALHQRILEQDPSLRPAPAPVDAATDAPAGATASRRRRYRGVAAVLAAGAVAAAVLAAVLPGRGEEAAAVAVPGNALVRLDPRSGAIRAVVDVGGTPTSVAVGEGAAWVLNADDQTISRVDRRTTTVRTFGSGGIPTDLAAGAGALWVGNGRRTGAQYAGPVATSVVRLDPMTTAARTAIALPAAARLRTNLQQDRIAAAGSAVWAVGPDASLSRIDARTDQVSAVVQGVRAAAVAVGGGQVWALGLDLSLVRVDARTARAGRPIGVAADGLSSLAVGGGSVWAADPDAGTVWRVTPGRRVVQRTIDVGTGVTDLAYGAGAVWAVNGLRGTVLRIDPRTNRVTRTIAVGNTPRQVAAGPSGVWVTVAGATGAPVPPAARAGRAGPALPSARCGPVLAAGGEPPDRLIVSDFPMRGGPTLPTAEMRDAIALVLRRRGFRAGRLRIGYQACDDSTAQTGTFDPDTCVANAKLYAGEPAVIGVIGPFNSGCAALELPVTGAARGGPVPMVSPTNTDVALTRRTPLAPPDLPGALYPSGRRHYVRLYAREDVTAAGAVAYAHDRGARRVAFLSDGGYGEPFALYGARAAQRLGMTVVASRRWRPDARGYGALAQAVAAARPDAVLVGGLLDTNGGRVLRDLRGRLPAGTPVILNDGFLPVAGLFAAAGRAAPGALVALSHLPVDLLPTEGSQLAAALSTVRGGQPVDASAVYAAQAAEVLLDAIAASDGSRSSILTALERTDVRRGLVGHVAFDAGGDRRSSPVVILRARHGGGSRAVESTDGAQVAGVVG